MLKINCLLTNRNIQDKVSEMVKLIGYELAANGKEATIEKVYRELRKVVEVDIQTVSAIYENVFDLDDPLFSSAEEIADVNDSGLRGMFSKQAQKIATNQIGKDNPVVAVSKSLLQAVAPNIKESPSVQKLMTERLRKAANKALKKIGVNRTIQSKTSEEILTEALTLLNNNQFYGLGLMESSQRLWNEFINEFDEMAAHAEDTDHYEAAKIRQLADELYNGTFQLLISTPEVRTIVNDALKRAGYTKKVNKRGVGEVDVVDWNKVFNDPNLSFETILNDAFGGVFEEYQIDAISNALKAEFDSMVNEKAVKMLEAQQVRPTPTTKADLVTNLGNALGLGRKTGELYISPALGEETIKYVLKKAKGGKYTKENAQGDIVIDWAKVMGDQQFSIADIIREVFGNNFSHREISGLVDAIAPMFEPMMQKKSETILAQKEKEVQPRTPSQQFAIDRLLNLYNYGIFDSANQTALMKVLGVSSATQQLINSVQNIVSLYNNAMQNELSKWSPTYLKTLERQINVQIEKLAKLPNAVNFMNKLGYYMQFNNAAILANPQNIAENILSGAFGELSTLVQNPRRFIPAMKDFAHKWLDFNKGGVRVGHEKLNAFNASGNLEDFYNAEVRSGKRSDVIATFVPRLLLSSFDNAFKFSMVNNIVTDLLYKELRRQGLNKQQASMVLNEAYYGNTDELVRISKRLSSNLVLSGVRTETSQGTQDGTTTKEKVIASELALANMLTNGKFFQDLLNQWVADGKITEAQAGTINFDDQLLRDIRDAAYSAASKELGHEADNVIVDYFAQGIEKIDKNLKEAKQKDDTSKYVVFKMMQLFMNGINKFRQGGLAWTFLGLQKASGLSLLQTVITDIVFPRVFKDSRGKWAGTGAALRYKDIDFTDLNKRAKALKDYQSLRQRLVRHTLAPLLGYSITGAILMAIKGSGDEEEKRKRLKEFINELDKFPALKRWTEKVAPIQLTNYIETINTIDINKIKGLGEKSMEKLEAAGIESVNLDNVDTVAMVLGLSAEKKSDLVAAIHANNAMEIPSLMSLYFSKDGIKAAFKQTSRPNPLIQLGLDLQDIRVPDKDAALGTFAGTVANLGGVLKSYDIWKNSITNPEKIRGEYKMIKPEGFVEAFAYNSLTKDMYKSLFKGESAYQLKLVDYPHIGEKGAALLEEKNIHKITDSNINEVLDILGYKPRTKSGKKSKEYEKVKTDIINRIMYHEKKVEQIK